MILAIDPGCTESAWACLNDDGTPRYFGKEKNLDLLRRVRAFPNERNQMVIESVASYGMAVGFEVFETCVWTGKFIEAWDNYKVSSPANRLYRQDIKLHLCGSVRAKDGNIRRALLDRFGGDKAAKGSKAKPGPCYGMSKDVWAALAVAVAWHDGVRSKIKGAA